MHLLRSLALVAAAAVVLTACSSLEESPPASVNDAEIDAGRLEDELVVVRESDDYQRLLEQQYEAPVDGTGAGTFDAAFVARLLSVKVYFALVDEKLDDLDIEIVEDDLLAAREELTAPDASGQVALTEESFATFPGWFQRVILRRGASIPKLSEALAEPYYDDNPEQFTQACPSHILVSTQQRSPTEARARIDDLARQLAEGADFAALAASESDDPTAAAAGGALGCGGPGRLVPEFEEVAFELPVGEVSEVVQTDFGFHLILVTERGRVSFDEAGAQAGVIAFNDFLRTATEESDIEVNPRYGEWVVAPEATGELARVVPPAGPTDPASAEGEAPAIPSGP